MREMAAKSTFILTRKDEAMVELIKETDHKTLGIWASACAERVLPYFENAYPDDQRPRQAIDALQAWIKTGIFRMAVIRQASLAAHAAARDVGADTAARSAARAAGQAVATAHVPSHAYGPAIYAQQAIYRATAPFDAAAAVAGERAWQYQRLCELRNTQERGCGDASQGHE